MLIETKNPIWVFIDDIDRLDEEEMRAMFTLVRSLADLPYITYVLALSDSVIADKLDKNGQSYLDKILQLTYRLPVPQERLMERLFLESTQEVFGPQIYSEQDETLQKAYELIRPYIKTVRHIYRLRDSLSLSYSAVAEEVFYFDFLLLEVLKLYEPKLYSLITSSRELVGEVKHSVDDLVKEQIEKYDWQKEKLELT